jgi:hypothetical protein
MAKQILFQNVLQRNRADGSVRLKAAGDRKAGADQNAAPVFKDQLRDATAVACGEGAPYPVHAARAVGQDDVLDTGFRKHIGRKHSTILSFLS